MTASQVFAKRGGVLGANLLPNQAPSLVQVASGPSQLEVIHVHNEEEAKLIMDIARPPSRNLFETNLNNMIAAMPLPIAPRIGVAIEGKNQRTNWITEIFP